GGHDDHGQARETRLHFLEQREAGLARHSDVRDDDAGIARSERLQDLLRRDERLVRNAVALESLLEDPADGTIVIDDPDGFHQGVSRQVVVQWLGGARTGSPRASLRAVPPRGRVPWGGPAALMRRHSW